MPETNLKTKAQDRVYLSGHGKLTTSCPPGKPSTETWLTRRNPRRGQGISGLRRDLNRKEEIKLSSLPGLDPAPGTFHCESSSEKSVQDEVSISNNENHAC